MAEQKKKEPAKTKTKKPKEKAEQKTDLMEKPEIDDRFIVHDESENAVLMDSARFNQLWRISSAFSRSDMVPEHFRGKAENCMICISMAIRMGVDPLMLLQNSYTVHGRPGIEAKLAIALVNRSGLFTTPIQYKMSGQGKTRACTAYATLKATGQVLEETVSMEMAVAEGWVKKPGSKWVTLPELMLKYRSAMFFARLYCPEVLMGMQTVDELVDTGGGIIDITDTVVDLTDDEPEEKPVEVETEPKPDQKESDLDKSEADSMGPDY